MVHNFNPDNHRLCKFCNDIIQRQMIPDWIFRRSVVWTFFIFSCRIWWQNTKPSLVPIHATPFSVSVLSRHPPTTFHEDLNSFFMRLVFIVAVTIEKICGFQFRNEWMIKSFPVCWMFMKQKEGKYVGRREGREKYFRLLLTKLSTSDNSWRNEWWFYDWNVDSLEIRGRSLMCGTAGEVFLMYSNNC